MDHGNALILAAGKTRLYRFNLLYYPLIKWMLRAIEASGVSRISIVCDDENSFNDIDFSEHNCQTKLVYLSDYTGTIDAFKAAADFFAGFDGPVLVFDAPMPAITKDSLLALLNNRLSVLQNGSVRILCADTKDLETPFASSPSFCLTEFANSVSGVSFASDDVIAWESFFEAESMASIAYHEDLLRRRMCRHFLENDVYIQSPDSTIISPTVRIAPGAQILTNSILYGETEIGKDAVIGPNALISSSRIGSATVVNASQIYDSVVGNDTKIGPFSYIRPGCSIGDHVKIGDFVELKKTTLGEGTKVSHLTYLGDADVGKNVNFGCGTVTVNYDGNKKYVTKVEDDAFIGCNTNLVAPVTVHRGAYTAAGTTITQDVPEDSLSIGRCRETIKENWVSSHLQKKK